MANNHEQFIAFNNAITATATRRNTLKTNRDALRDKIRKYFKENWPDKPSPSFYWQGSYAMSTLLNPIKDEDGLGAYDLDDGIYFFGDVSAHPDFCEIENFCKNREIEIISLDDGPLTDYGGAITF